VFYTGIAAYRKDKLKRMFQGQEWLYI